MIARTDRKAVKLCRRAGRAVPVHLAAGRAAVRLPQVVARGRACVPSPSAHARARARGTRAAAGGTRDERISGVRACAAGGWNCRVAMTNDANSFRIPFTLPLWGVVEPRHIHVDNHINFVFHMDQGWIIGAAAYPSACPAPAAAMATAVATASADGAPAAAHARPTHRRSTHRRQSANGLRRRLRPGRSMCTAKHGRARPTRPLPRAQPYPVRNPAPCATPPHPDRCPARPDRCPARRTSGGSGSTALSRSSRAPT